MNRIFALWWFCAGCVAMNSIAAGDEPGPVVRFHLITLDPGHFHAALVQKMMYTDVDPQVRVYAPEGEDLRQHLQLVESFNTRSNRPTHWREEVYTGPDFLKKMVAEKPGNVVVIAGNNSHKTDYIVESVQAGLNVLADKPMAITPADFSRLQLAFAAAASNHVLVYDIMTERYEATTLLQCELSQQPALFGELERGSPDEPAVVMKSVHYFSKLVAGTPLRRPEWFFDVRQQGEGIVDVSAHLVDLVQFEAFPDQVLNPDDVTVLSAKRWTTPITREQFKQVTGADDFPAFLSDDVKDGVLQVCANGEFTYRLRGVYARVIVNWDFSAPPGCGDTHYSMMRGTKARLVIRQGAEQNFKPVLYVEPGTNTDAQTLARTLKYAIRDLQRDCPGVGCQREGNVWRIVVPEKYDVGHEIHFAQVTLNFLHYLHEGQLPAWEASGMLTKYATLMQAYRLSR